MSELKPCHTCDQKECDFKHNGKDFVCSRGYALTAEDKQRLLHESYEEGVRNGEFSKLKPCPFKRITHTYTDGRAWIPATGVTFIGEGELVGPAIDRLALYEKLLQMDPAEAALMFRRAQPVNDPLTMEQLREIDKNPVWIVDIKQPQYSGWAQYAYYDAEYDRFAFWTFGSEMEDSYRVDDYGKTWIAYEHKPEEVSHAE